MSDEIFKIPTRLTARSLSVVYTEFAQFHNGTIPKNVTFDFTNLSFAEPTGIVFLGNLIDFFAKHKSQIKFIENKAPNASMNYLYDSQFFRDHFNFLSSQTRLRPTTFNLTKMSAEKSPQWLENHFIPWVQNATSKNIESLYSLQSSVSELFNNIDNHTEMDIGFIFAQHYPQKKHIKIALGDFGHGIPNKIRILDEYKDFNDYDAIVKATEEGVSSKSTPRNRGRGLFQLLSSIVIGYKGTVTIYSGQSAVNFYNLKEKIAYEEVKNIGFCHGTTIEIYIEPDKIIEYETEEEVSW